MLYTHIARTIQQKDTCAYKSPYFQWEEWGNSSETDLRYLTFIIPLKQSSCDDQTKQQKTNLYCTARLLKQRYVFNCTCLLAFYLKSQPPLQQMIYTTPLETNLKAQQNYVDQRLFKNTEHSSVSKKFILYISVD